jgi:hypothetical protein
MATNDSAARPDSFPTGYPNPKVNRLLYTVGAISDFDERDFLDLAMACLDQAGKLVDKRTYERILVMVGAEMTPAIHRGTRVGYRGIYPVVFVSEVSTFDPEGDSYQAAKVDLYLAPGMHEEGIEVVIPEGKDADEVIGAELLKRWGVTLPAPRVPREYAAQALAGSMIDAGLPLVAQRPTIEERAAAIGGTLRETPGGGLEFHRPERN